jgi:nitrogen-specific signal transduction histidine kinase
MAGDFDSWLLESLSSAVVTVDEDGRLVTFNASARRMLAVAEQSCFPGADSRRALASHPELLRLLLETLEGAAPLSRAELALSHATGATTIGLTLSSVRDPAGRVRGAALLFRDLAPIERGDEQDRLRDRLAALGQMAAGLAHEIRNPLAAMEVQVGLLRRRLADRPEDCELIEELTGELRAVADAVSASLEYVKPVPPSVSEVDLAELLEQALATGLSRVCFDGVVERSADGPLPRVRADEEQLRTLLVNLVVNALEAMQGLPQPTLSLAVRPTSASELEICVSDSGPGVPAQLREKVFYPFFSTRPGGSGVGLALAQKIALSHGGRLELDAAPEGGCVARLQLPAETESAASDERAAPGRCRSGA